MTIIYQGVSVGTFPAVQNPKLQFRVGESGVRKRIGLPNKIVLHWTGGENGASSCFNTLKKRGLSVQFHCAYDGTITQYCDANLVCSHAGKANPSSIGIEIDNAGFPPGSKNHPRQSYKASIRGVERTFLAFSPAQVESIVAWCNDLCSVISIPKKLLRDSNGNIIHSTVIEKTFNSFSGVLGHYQISKEKSDPGPQLLESLGQRGFQ